MNNKVVLGAGARVPSPCLNCKQRFVGCHDVCGFYMLYREKLTDANNKIAEDKLNSEENNSWSYAKRRKKVNGN